MTVVQGPNAESALSLCRSRIAGSPGRKGAARRCAQRDRRPRLDDRRGTHRRRRLFDSMTLDPDQLRDFARRYTDAWCSQDPAKVAEHYAPEGSLTINAGQPAEGRATITEVVRSFMTVFPDMQVLLDDLTFREGGGEFHWTLIGTNSGPGRTGNSVRISG